MRAAWNRRLARLVAVASTAAVLPLVGPVPSASALVVPIPMGVGVRSVPNPSIATAHEVCAWGYAASATSRWELVITGARLLPAATGDGATTADLSGWVIAERRSSTSPTFNTCLTIDHAGAPAGHFQATLSYAGVGIDVIGTLVGRGTWVGNFSDSNSTSIGGPPMP